MFGKEGLGKGVRELSEASELMRGRERRFKCCGGSKWLKPTQPVIPVASAGQTGLARLTKKMLSYDLIILV